MQKLILFLAIVCAIVLLLPACGKPHDGTSIVGPSGNTGLTGVQGPTGAPGIAGPQGEPGVDASPVTVVQLCPGTTVYPNKFVEVAFCIDGQLYGTYSANGGFSTLLPPGVYSSNGVGSSCNFTIGNNCEVIQ